MKRLYVMFIVLILLAGTISTAYADCYKDGKAHPIGTIVDGFKCTAGGNWVQA